MVRFPVCLRLKWRLGLFTPWCWQLINVAKPIISLPFRDDDFPHHFWLNSPHYTSPWFLDLGQPFSAAKKLIENISARSCHNHPWMLHLLYNQEKYKGIFIHIYRYMDVYMYIYIYIHVCVCVCVDEYIYIFIYICVYTHIHYTTWHDITLHYITLYTLHYTTLHYTTLRDTTQHDTTQHDMTYIPTIPCHTIPYPTLHCITVHYSTLQYITLHFIHTLLHTPIITFIYLDISWYISYIYIASSPLCCFPPQPSHLLLLGPIGQILRVPGVLGGISLGAGATAHGFNRRLNGSAAAHRPQQGTMAQLNGNLMKNPLLMNFNLNFPRWQLKQLKMLLAGKKPHGGLHWSAWLVVFGSKTVKVAQQWFSGFSALETLSARIPCQLSSAKRRGGGRSWA